MKKFPKFLSLLVLSTIGLTSCALFSQGNGGVTSGDTSQSQKEEIKDFEFVKDERLTWEDKDYGSFYSLELSVGETYQVKTSIDDKLGNDYEIKYTIDDSAEGFTVSESGLITANASLEKNAVGSLYAKLYKKGSTRVIKSHYIIVTVYKEVIEYVEASINDDTLSFDKATNTYTVSLNAGDRYNISLNTKTNTQFKKEFSLTDASYADFMSVSEIGAITTMGNISENKTGKVMIVFKSEKSNKVLSTLYLVVNITAKAAPVNTLVVTNTLTNTNVNENDVVSMRVGDELTFQVKYNGSLKYNALSTTATNIEIDSVTNKITALSVGEATVVARYDDKTLSFKINVSANNLSRIYAQNEGDDFVIHNGALHIIGKMYAVFESGLEKEITLTSGLTYSISNSSSTHKSVEFSYTKDGVTKKATYLVKFFVSEAYNGEETAFDFMDYGRAMYAQCHYLTNEGNLKFLVIPVWFTNSTSFFNVSQKTQIKEDITSKMLGEKTSATYWSVKSFYETESRGKLSISATISDFYESNTRSTAYTDSDDSRATYDLAKKATQWYFENNPSDSISNYDADNDGKVDSVILFYSANYYGEQNAIMRSTAYAWADSTNSRNYNTGAFCSVGAIYGFKKTSNVSAQLAASDLSTVNPSGFIRGASQVIHEVGHQFGAKDIYEYAASGETKNYPAGQFSMQDNDSGSHDPYHMNLFGWSKPDIYASKDYQVGEQITIAVDDFQSSGNNIILSRDWNTYNSLFDEYMILELFTPTGLNEFDASRLRISDVGFRVWHVNSILDNDSQNINASGSNQLKYSTIDRTCEFDLVHLIRNNVDTEIDCQQGLQGTDLFKENDQFSIPMFSKQFVKRDRLDNEEKLGWEFKVDKIYQKENGKYTGIVTLTRVDSTRTQFKANATMKNGVTQPEGNTNEIGAALLNNENLLMNYAYNSSTKYGSDTAIDGYGIDLYGATNGDGGSLEISIKDKTGYTTYINSVKLVYSIMTNGVLKATANGNEITPTRFQGPESKDAADAYDCGRIYEVNAKSVKLQNCFTGTINHVSQLRIISLEIEFTIIQN